MFNRKSNQQNNSNRPQNNSKRNLSQFGLMDVTNFDINDDNFDDDEDDDDLEAELLALTSEDSSKKAVSRKSKSVINPNNLNEMIQNSLRDIPSDEDVSSGEDDPSILAELEQLHRNTPNIAVEKSSNSSEPASNSVRTMLEERLKMYEIAEENAKKANEASKARRMTRGIATLKDLVKKCDAGHFIKEEEIPPVVSVNVTKPDEETIPCIPSEPLPTSPPESVPPVNLISNIENNHIVLPSPDNLPITPPPVPPRAAKRSSPASKEPHENEPKMKSLSDDTAKSLSVQNDVDFLKKRKEHYKVAALVAKKNGDKETAVNYVRIMKQFDVVINQVSNGAVLDSSTIPPELDESCLVADVHVRNESPTPLQKQESLKLTSSSTDENITVAAENSSSNPAVVDEPKTILEALEQRLKKFQESEEAAKNANDGRKVRQMGRIVNQYKDAIRLHKAGKAIPIDELPTPPGFAPIPVEGVSSAPALVQPSTNLTPAVQPVLEKKPLPSPVNSTSPDHKNAPGPSSGQLTRNEQQLRIVLDRQKAYKLAALNAKNNEDLVAAREYLRIAKGMDPMIEASKCGLPLDLNTLPLPPEEKQSLESQYEVVRLNDCIEGTQMEVYNKLILDLQHQLETCMKTRDHYRAVGDIANANRFEQFASHTKKDLKFVQLADSSNLPVPKFHYETKPFTIVQCNTDLTDNDIEVIVVQGINYNVPNPQEVDTYVKLYFPYPQETPQQYKTSVVYNTNNPTYNVAVKFNIQRTVRACQRIFKRQTLKCEVWTKGGFFRSDTLIGTANAKLQPLETQCTIHDAFDLMDGRRTVGGKLELKVKARDPILKKEVVHVEEKWLIIDS